MKFDISHTAKLANIPLRNDEKEKLAHELEATLEHVQRLQEIPTDTVPPTNHVTGLQNITREDEAFPSLTQKQALQNAKAVYHGFIKVKAILEQ